MRPRSPVAALLAAFVWVVWLDGQAPRPAQPPQPPSFRTRITMVPVDVRVVDSRGRPITDLRQDDFTITEDGVPQAIRHFAALALTPEPASASAAPEPLLRTRSTPGPTPQNRRVFLFLLGRGRLTGPSKEAEALAAFMRERLLPQDQVAILGYNRATDFTTDHTTIAAVVERYRERHEKIEQMLLQHFSGLRAIYGSKEIPPRIQAEIDEVFSGVPGLRPRSVVPGQMTDASQVAADVRRTADELLRAEVLAAREGMGLPDPAAAATAERMDVTFDDYIAGQSELSHDVGNLYAGIDYMRYLDGEKHLAFITPRGVSLPRRENVEVLARAASDARIAIDIIYTGGVVGAPPPRFVGVGPSRQLVMHPVPTAAQVFGQTFNMQDLRVISEITGGQMAAFRYGREALNRIDEATRFQYLLAYYPANPAIDGRYRKVEITVNRRGATVLYRRGYYASSQLVPLDRRQFIVEQRIAAAGRYDGAIRDIAVTLASAVASKDELTVTLNLQSPRTQFVQTDDRHVASLQIAIFCVDDKQRVVGELRQTMDLRLRDDGYQAFREKGRDHTARVPLSGAPEFVKVIVYDPAADITGSAAVKVK